MISIRISEIFGKSEQTQKSKRLKKLLILSGVISVIIILVTIYGQYTGTFVISMTKEAENKGISLSETKSFDKKVNDLRVEPLNDVEDTLESLLNIEEAEKTDGQFYEKGQDYLAYTFYLKNTGNEVVNINHKIRITEELKGIGNAAKIKIREYSLDENNRFTLNYDRNYMRDQNNLVADINFTKFRPDEIRKYTFFVWLDGERTDESMLGGTIKFEWVFSISNANVGEE